MTRLRVDPIACDAFGYCAELVPEMIGRDEWGFPVLRDGPVPPALLDLARRAVADCPRRALSLVDGPVRGTAPRTTRVRLASSRSR
jgi:ferredoxin